MYKVIFNNIYTGINHDPFLITKVYMSTFKYNFWVSQQCFLAEWQNGVFKGGMRTVAQYVNTTSLKEETQLTTNIYLRNNLRVSVIYCGNNQRLRILMCGIKSLCRQPEWFDNKHRNLQMLVIYTIYSANSLTAVNSLLYYFLSSNVMLANCGLNNS